MDTHWLGQLHSSRWIWHIPEWRLPVPLQWKWLWWQWLLVLISVWYLQNFPPDLNFDCSVLIFKQVFFTHIPIFPPRLPLAMSAIIIAQQQQWQCMLINGGVFIALWRLQKLYHSTNYVFVMAKTFFWTRTSQAGIPVPLCLQGVLPDGRSYQFSSVASDIGSIWSPIKQIIVSSGSIVCTGRGTHVRVYNSFNIRCHQYPFAIYEFQQHWTGIIVFLERKFDTVQSQFHFRGNGQKFFEGTSWRAGICQTVILGMADLTPAWGCLTSLPYASKN